MCNHSFPTWLKNLNAYDDVSDLISIDRESSLMGYVYVSLEKLSIWSSNIERKFLAFKERVKYEFVSFDVLLLQE